MFGLKLFWSTFVFTTGNICKKSYERDAEDRKTEMVANTIGIPIGYSFAYLIGYIVKSYL
jgi:hypothetical protein